MADTWTPITQAWQAPNGVFVNPVSSLEDLAAIGNTLNNGLREEWARIKWGGLCSEGRRQILALSDGQGTPLGVSMLRVVPAQGGDAPRATVEAMFVRGQGNSNFRPGEPPSDAVAAYVDLLNDREPQGVEWVGRIGRSAFLDVAAYEAECATPIALEGDVAEEPRDLSPLEIAARQGQAEGLSPLQALLRGLGLAPAAPPPPQENATLEQSWVPLSEEFRLPSGWKVTPIRNAKEMKFLGEELDNLMMFDPGFIAAVHSAVEGQARYVAIKDARDVIRGYGQFGCSGGFPALRVARGYCDEKLAVEAVDVMKAYVRGLFDGSVEMNVIPGTDLFRTPEEAADHGGRDLADAMARPAQFLLAPFPAVYGPKAPPTEEELAEMERRRREEGDWQVPVGEWRHPGTGLAVRLVNREAELRALGVAFQNHLAIDQYRTRIVQQAIAGEHFVVAVLEDGRPIANGYIGINDTGSATLDFLFGPGRTEVEARRSLPPAAVSAVNDWLENYNSGALLRPDRGIEGPGLRR